MGALVWGFLGCSDAGGSSANQSIDERCPYAHVPGVVFALRREDGTDACVYQCRVVDDAGVHPAELCGPMCIAVDTPMNCGSCGHRCGNLSPYCDLGSRDYCTATRPASTPLTPDDHDG